MTEIEILLSVDAGQSPPNTVTIFMDDRDPDVRARWLARFLIALAVLLAAGSIAVGLTWGRKALAPVALMLLGAGMAAVKGTPTAPEPEAAPPKRPVMVVTETGVIVRGDWGVKMWRFEDLADVVAGVDAERRPLLELWDRDGTRYRLRCSGYRCWRRAQQAVGPHLSI